MNALLLLSVDLRKNSLWETDVPEGNQWNPIWVRIYQSHRTGLCKCFRQGLFHDKVAQQSDDSTETALGEGHQWPPTLLKSGVHIQSFYLTSQHLRVDLSLLFETRSWLDFQGTMLPWFSPSSLISISFSFAVSPHLPILQAWNPPLLT